MSEPQPDTLLNEILETIAELQRRGRSMGLKKAHKEGDEYVFDYMGYDRKLAHVRCDLEETRKIHEALKGLLPEN